MVAGKERYIVVAGKERYIVVAGKENTKNIRFTKRTKFYTY
jgi:hypothetical protein